MTIVLGWMLTAAVAAEPESERIEAGPGLPGVRFASEVEREPVPADWVDLGPYPGTLERPPAFHWRVALPGEPLNSATHAEYSRPVIIGDTVLVGSARGSALYRMSRTDGTVLGSYPASAAVQGEPLVVDDQLFFSDTDGVTWAYTLEGQLLWSYRGTAPILVRPTLHEGVVYVTNVDDLAVALDAESGSLLWRYQAKTDLLREAELRLYAAPPGVVLGDVVVLGFSDGSLVGVDLKTGEERWAKRIGEGRYPDIVAEPVVWQDDVFASAYFEPFVAVDQESRTVRWRADVGAAFGVVVDDIDEPTVVYHPGTDGTLRAYSALTGAERWAWDSDTSGAVTAPVLTDAGLFVGTSESGLALVHAETGETLWRFHEPYRLVGMSSSPVVEGRQVLFTTNAGYLYSMLQPRETPERERLWSGSGFFAEERR